MADKYAIQINGDLGRRFLSGIQSFCYGDKLLACFDSAPHMAMPFDKHYAEQVVSLLRADLAPNTVIKFSIVSYPLREEVSGN